MIKVGLLGDSIRLIGYGTVIDKALGEGYEVFQPQDNCRFAKYMLRSIFECREELPSCDIIHFNCGLWDICNIMGDGELFTSEKEYEDSLRRIIKVLKGYTKNIIFATTTPCRRENIYNKNADIERYNEIAINVMKLENVAINDLYATVSSNIEEYIRADDNLHLTDKGIEVCAEQVADAIRKINL